MLALTAVAAAAAVALAVPAAAPPPNAPLPSGAAPVAQRLTAATDSLYSAVAFWRASEAPRPPRELRLWALHQQRLYLALGLARPQVGEAVVGRLPRELRANARDVLTARRSLVRLTPPTSDRCRLSELVGPNRPSGSSATTGRRSVGSVCPGRSSPR